MSVRSNFLWYGMPRLLDRIGAVLLLPVYTRVLAPEEFGIAMVSIAIGTASSLFVAPGAETAYLRSMTMGDDKGAPEGIASLHLLSALLGTLLLVAVADPLGALLMPGVPLYPFYYVVIATLVVNSLQAPVRAEWRARGLVHRVAALETVQFTISTLTILVTLLWLDWGPISILLGGLAASVLVLPVSLLKLFGLIGRRATFADLRRAGPLLYVGLPIALHGYAAGTLDRILINRYSGSAEVSIYAAGYQIGAIVIMMTVIMNKEWRPLVFSLAYPDDRARPELQSLWTNSLTLFLAFGAAVAFSARPLASFILGEAYAASAFIIPLVAVAGVMAVPRAFLIHLGLAEGKTRHLAIESLSSVIFLAFACLVLIPIAGGPGAAFSVALCYAAGVVYLYTRRWNCFRVNPSIMPWVAIFCAAAAVGYVPLDVTPTLLVGGSLWVAAAGQAIRYWQYLGRLS